MIQTLVGVILLLRHTENTSDSLCRKLETSDCAEDEQDSGTGAVPSESDSLLEKQSLGRVVGLLYCIEVVSLFARQPNSEFAVGNCNAVGFERSQDVVLYIGIIFCQLVAIIIG